MTARPIIRVGDKTTHGGTVLEGFSSYDIDGRAAAGLGHKVGCPKCKESIPSLRGLAASKLYRCLGETTGEVRKNCTSANAS